MKRALLSIGAAAVLAVALPMSADAQFGPGGGAKGGPAAAGAPAGGGGGFAGRGGGPSGGGAMMGGGPRGGFSGGGFAGRGGGPGVSPRVMGPGVAGPGVVGPGVVRPGGGSPRVATNGRGAWQGGDWRHRHRFRRSPVFAFGFGAPYYSDYATPYAYDDDDCYRIRRVQTPRGWVARRIWVCD